MSNRIGEWSTKREAYGVFMISRIRTTSTSGKDIPSADCGVFGAFRMYLQVSQSKFLLFYQSIFGVANGWIASYEKGKERT
jgi:hypothetical protein